MNASFVNRGQKAAVAASKCVIRCKQLSSVTVHHCQVLLEWWDSEGSDAFICCRAAKLVTQLLP